MLIYYNAQFTNFTFGAQKLRYIENSDGIV